jgi:hypothetical protein
VNVGTLYLALRRRDMFLATTTGARYIELEGSSGTISSSDVVKEIITKTAT